MFGVSWLKGFAWRSDSEGTPSHTRVLSAGPSDSAVSLHCSNGSNVLPSAGLVSSKADLRYIPLQVKQRTPFTSRWLLVSFTVAAWL